MSSDNPSKSIISLGPQFKLLDLREMLTVGDLERLENAWKRLGQDFGNRPT